MKTRTRLLVILLTAVLLLGGLPLSASAALGSGEALGWVKGNRISFAMSDGAMEIRPDSFAEAPAVGDLTTAPGEWNGYRFYVLDTTGPELTVKRELRLSGVDCLLNGAVTGNLRMEKLTAADGAYLWGLSAAAAGTYRLRLREESGETYSLGVQVSEGNFTLTDSEGTRGKTENVPPVPISFASVLSGTAGAPVSFTYSWDFTRPPLGEWARHLADDPNLVNVSVEGVSVIQDGAATGNTVPGLTVTADPQGRCLRCTAAYPAEGVRYYRVTFLWPESGRADRYFGLRAGRLPLPKQQEEVGLVTEETTDASGNKTIAVTTGEDGDAVANIVIAKEPGEPKAFSDVPENKWFTAAVKEASARSLFNGTSATEFSPGQPLTRGMLVTVLYNLSGKVTFGTGRDVFADVKQKAFYAKAADWANAVGVAMGTGGKLNPSANITRQDLVSMLYRYAKVIGTDADARAALSFPDADQAAGYARDALQWAVAEGFLSGRADGGVNYLAPRGSATRAEVALIMTRFVSYLQK